MKSCTITAQIHVWRVFTSKNAKFKMQNAKWTIPPSAAQPPPFNKGGFDVVILVVGVDVPDDPPTDTIRTNFIFTH